MRIEELPIRSTFVGWGRAAYDHRTGEILMVPWWRREPSYLVSLAHEVGHMLHHQEVGTEKYLQTPFLEAEREAWERGMSVAQEWGIQEKYRDVAEGEINPFGVVKNALKPQEPSIGPPLPKILKMDW